MMDNWEEAWAKYFEKVIERLGWVGAILVILGYYLNANQLTSSWVVWIIGNVLVAIYSYHKKAYSTALMSLIIMIMNVYGYISWGGV
jgi:C4-dicarboxylate transporter